MGNAATASVSAPVVQSSHSSCCLFLSRSLSQRPAKRSLWNVNMSHLFESWWAVKSCNLTGFCSFWTRSKALHWKKKKGWRLAFRLGELIILSLLKCHSNYHVTLTDDISDVNCFFNLCNSLSVVGVIAPPYCFVLVQWNTQYKQIKKHKVPWRRSHFKI